MNKFVFAVCGAKNYISQLAFSIERLKRFSRNEIIVVTDSRRNEIPISHENIIDIATPSEYNDHEASIFLKTSLHKILPYGHTYCYLDSDVVCLSEKVDEIFLHYSAPITFANDNAPFEYFSPHAMNCQCLENHAYHGEIIAKFKAEVSKRIVFSVQPATFCCDTCHLYGRLRWESLLSASRKCAGKIEMEKL